MEYNMNIKIQTRWGVMNINPEEIYEINVKINPWDNVWRIEFIMEQTYTPLYADMASSTEIANVIRKVSIAMDHIRQYKYRDQHGVMQINEPRRLALMNSVPTGEE